MSRLRLIFVVYHWLMMVGLIRNEGAVQAVPTPGAMADGMSPLAEAYLTLGSVALKLKNVTQDESVSGCSRKAVCAAQSDIQRVMDVVEAMYRSQGTDTSFTGLPKKDVMDDRIKLILAGALQPEPGSNKEMFLVSVDVDNLKSLNDVVGHEAADEFIWQVGQSLAATCALHGAFVAHLHGDEFAILVTGTREETVAFMIECLADVNKITTPLGPLSVSGGISAYSGKLADPKAWYDRADEALTSAKIGGRNRFNFWINPAERNALSAEVFELVRSVSKDSQMSESKALGKIKRVIEAGASLDYVHGEANGLNIVMQAIQDKRWRIVRYFAGRCKFNANYQRPSDGWTTLVFAIEMGAPLDVVNMLASKRQNPNTKDKAGKPIMTHALNAAVRARTTGGETPRAGDSSPGWDWDSVISTLIYGGADDLRLEIRELLARGGSTYKSIKSNCEGALQLTESAGEPFSIEELKPYFDESGMGISADVVVDDWGNTALGAAAYEGNLEAVKYLIDKGADPMLTNLTGASPLQQAIEHGHLEISELLLQYSKKRLADDPSQKMRFAQDLAQKSCLHICQNLAQKQYQLYGKDKATQFRWQAFIRDLASWSQELDQLQRAFPQRSSSGQDQFNSRCRSQMQYMQQPFGKQKLLQSSDKQLQYRQYQTDQQALQQNDRYDGDWTLQSQQDGPNGDWTQQWQYQQNDTDSQWTQQWQSQQNDLDSQWTQQWQSLHNDPDSQCTQQSHQNDPDSQNTQQSRRFDRTEQARGLDFWIQQLHYQVRLPVSTFTAATKATVAGEADNSGSKKSTSGGAALFGAQTAGGLFGLKLTVGQVARSAPATAA